jgi:hypothetical protein
VFGRVGRVSRLQLMIGAGVVAAATAAVVGAFVASGNGEPVARPHTAVVSSTTTTTMKRRVLRTLARCPLTDLPAAYGIVPHRPAVFVKIGNEPGPARPQSGLNEADIVFDTPAEGFIMRYMAVYQCGGAPRIGPTRSVRWVDYHLAPQFGDSVIAFAGGIDPNLQAVATTPGIIPANLLGAQATAGYRTTDRSPPDNLYTSTEPLYALADPHAEPPKPVFDYTPALPAGAAPLESAELNFSPGTDVTWTWQPATKSWLHTYAGVPDIDALTNQPVTATNIVVEIVSYSLGPFIESTGGSGDIQSSTTGTGIGYVLRDGHYTPVKWSRATTTATTKFTTANGRPVGLAPGRTWIELITTTQASDYIHFHP